MGGLKPGVGLLLAWLLLLPSFAVAADGSESAQHFDELFAEITAPASVDLSQEAKAAKLDRLRTLLPPDDAARDARFHAVYCASSHWNDNERALAFSREALRLAQAADDLASQGRARICIAGYLLPLHGSTQALAEANEAVAVAELAQAPVLLGEALMTRGSLLSRVGEQAKALLDFQRARAAFRDAGIDHEIEVLLLRLAVTYRRIGDWEHAELYFSQLLARMEVRQDWEGMAGILIQLGYLHHESGAPDKALLTFKRAVDVAMKPGNADHADRAGFAQLGLADVQISQGKHDDALATLALARAGFAKAGIRQSEGLLLLLTGQGLAGKGQHAEALPLYRKALPLMEQDGNERYQARLYLAMAASEEALGHSDQALADYKRYSELQAILQRKMQLEQNRLLAYEHEVRTGELENNRLRAEADARQQHVETLERVRNWQRAALLLGVLLIIVLVRLAWRQQRRSRQLRTLAMTDTLTGVANRIAIEAAAEHALAQVARSGTRLTLLALDLDHFKAINDRYGHAAGDAVLRAATAAWRTQLRDSDTLGRIGGEEFVVVCAGASLGLAQAIAERLLQTTRDIRLADIDPAMQISTSIGLAEAGADDTRESLFARADAALYRAKSLGRDRAEN